MKPLRWIELQHATECQSLRHRGGKARAHPIDDELRHQKARGAVVGLRDGSHVHKPVKAARRCATFRSPAGKSDISDRALAG